MFDRELLMSLSAGAIIELIAYEATLLESQQQAEDYQDLIARQDE